MEKTVHLITYGAKLPQRPTVALDAIVDCRRIRNPFMLPKGQHERAILASPGFAVTLGAGLTDILEGLRHADHLEVGVFCAYGLHRSPRVADTLAKILHPLGVHTTIDHLSIRPEAGVPA